MEPSAKHLALLSITVLLLGVELLGRSKTDLVVLDNGDSVHGEITGLSRGVLTLKTEWMGTLQIEWIRIKEIRSDHTFEVVLSDGRKGLGSLRSDSEARVLAISDKTARLETAQRKVVGITPIEGRFLKSLKFSVELGASYYSSNSAKQLSIGSSARYRTKKWGGSANISTISSGQQDAPSTQRRELRTSAQRFFSNNWSAISIANFLHSEELNLDLRSILGGGVTKELVRTNRSIFTVLGGLAVNRERYFEEPIQNSAEGLTGIRFEMFQFDKPEFDLTSTFYAIPSFSDWGRLRIEFDLGLRFKLFRDLYWSGSLFENHDSRPPEGNRKNDFGVQTTFGWMFN